MYEFGEYRLDPRRRILAHRTGETIQVTGRVFDTLLHFLEHPDQLISKRELLDAVWGEVVVEENNLTQAVSTLRQILGERPDEHRFIVTVPGRGYRFIAPVSEVEESQPNVATASPTIVASVGVPTHRPTFRLGHWLVAAGLVSVVLIALAIFALHRGPRPLAHSTVRTIAVLPFKPLITTSGDPALEVGMADTLITQLSASHGLIVRPLSSVRKYADVNQDPLAAGRALAVDAVLDGSIQRVDDVLRVTARLIRVEDGASIWVDKIDQPWTDVFRVQDAIAEQVVSALEVQLTIEGRQRLTHRGTDSADAYRLYLLGRYHYFKLVPSEIDKAIDYFGQAIREDPNYALAFTGLAEASRALVITSDRPPSQVLPQGKAAALRAIAIDGNLDDAYASLCFIQIWSDWDWSAAERSCKRAIELNPNGADGHRAYAVLLSDLGRHAEAIAEARRATQLDPLSLITNAIEGHVLHYAGRDDAATARLQATLELDANFWIAHLFLGKIDLRRGQFDAALQEFRNAKQFSGGNSEAVSMLGYTLARMGDRRGAQAAIEELQSRSAARYVPPFNIAMIYNALEDRAKTFEWLEKAYADRDVRLTFLKVEWKWDPVRSDPRFASIAQRVGLN